MTALAVMQAIVAIEESIVLPAVVAQENGLNNYKAVKKAYIHGPDKATNLTNLPCFINWYDAEPEVLRMGNFVEHNETIEVDFYAEDSDRGRLYAMAFYDATMAAFHAEEPSGRHFGGTVDLVNVRSESPAVATMEWNGLGYPGFKIFLDLTRFEQVVPV